MRLPSLRFLRRKPAADAPAPRVRPKVAPPGDDNAVAAARTAARHRLVGALVLLLIGIVGFPMLFETQPRPLPLDIPIAVPLRDGSAAAPAADRKPLPVPSLPADAGTEVAVAPALSVTPAPATAEPESAPAINAPAPAPPPTVAPAMPAQRAAQPESRPREDARVRGLLEGAAPTPASVAPASSAAGRFVVQVGAFTDATTLREARSKVEKLGLKTYTQVIENDAGKRTRVRVGPFSSREEADAAASRLKGSGLPANVLTL